MSELETITKECKTMTLDYVNQYGEIIDGKTLRAKDCVDAFMIVKNLYLGSYEYAAKMDDGLKVLGVTHILSIGHSSQMPRMFPDRITYKTIELDDHEFAKIEKHFKEAIEFISEALQNKENKVLVHCWAGVSRSATLIIAYLIRVRHQFYTEAYETVRKARYWINPNRGFQKKLIKWANECGLGEPTETINLYGEARKILFKLYKKKLSMDEKTTVLETFEQIFGRYHPHFLDVVDELCLSDD